MTTARPALEQAIALQRSEVLRLQRVVQIELPQAQTHLARLERLLDKLTPASEVFVNDIIKEVVR